MRISVREGDSGYRPPRDCKNVRVLLDGSEVTRVFTADEEQRFILRYATDENGHMFLTRDRDGAQEEVRRGTVVIEERG